MQRRAELPASPGGPAGQGLSGQVPGGHSHQGLLLPAVGQSGAALGGCESQWI